MANTPRPNFLGGERSSSTPERAKIKEQVSAETEPAYVPAATVATTTTPVSNVEFPGATPSPATLSGVTEQRLRRILSEDMAELITPLTLESRREFQAEGLKTVSKLEELLRRTHIQLRQVWKLLWDWLKRLPGVNRFFLEQEVKKKTEEIMELKEELDQTRSK